MAHCDKKCLTIMMTENCNLNCKYCYCNDTNKKKRSIDVEFAKCAINDFVKNGNSLFVRFFGNGEPTLEFEKIKEIVNYCKSISEETQFEIQTNGVFDADKRKWIAKNIDIIWISYDGTTEANDYYRRNIAGHSVTDIVENNIRYLSKHAKSLGVRSTIGRKNLYNQIDIVNQMLSLGVSVLYSDLLFADVKDKNYFEDGISPMEYAKEFLKAKRYAMAKGIYYGSIFTVNFDREVDIFCRACIPMPHLTVDGYVSCCDMGYAQGDLKKLLYGKYDKESKSINYDDECLKYIKNRKVENLKECSKCEIKYHCAGGCIGEALNENGDIYSIKKQNCEAIKYLANNLLETKEIIPMLHP